MKKVPLLLKNPEHQAKQHKTEPHQAKQHEEKQHRTRQFNADCSG